MKQFVISKHYVTEQKHMNCYAVRVFYNLKMTAFWDKFIALMMEAVRTSETSVYFNNTTRHYIPEDCNLNTLRREENKSYISQIIKESFRWWAGVAQSVSCLTTDCTTGVRSSAEATDFSSSFCVQTGSVIHPASCTMGNGVLSPEVVRGRGVTLTMTLI
jgi:hypothetical protein